MISVIVPVYQVEKYLPACIDSILAQSYTDFEVILVDDGSPDSCGRICDAYARKDDRIRVIHQENQGLSVARNTGTDHARGDYITYVDSDDLLHPDFLKELYDTLINTGAEVSICHFTTVLEGQGFPALKGKSSDAVRCYTGREAAALIVEQSLCYAITAWGKLYSKELVSFLRYPAGRLHEDEFVTYKVLYQAKMVAVSDRPYYGYLQRSGNITGVYTERRLDKLAALEEAISYFEVKQDTELADAARKRYLLNLRIAWYRVYTEMNGRDDLLEKLREQHREFYRKNRHVLKRNLSLIERFSVQVFRAAPRLYCTCVSLYVNLFSKTE